MRCRKWALSEYQISDARQQSQNRPGPGHNTVLCDGGKDHQVSHASYYPKDDGRPQLQLLPLTYDHEAWPQASVMG